MLLQKGGLNIKIKEKLVTALSSIPLIAGATMSASCAAGCPYYGLSCSAPGQCPRFTDSGDGICDLAQSTSTSSPSDTPTSYDTSNTNSGSAIDSGSSVSTPDQTAQSSSVSSDQVNTNTDANASAVTDQGSGLDSGSISSDGTNYYLFPISILLIGLYLFTYFLFNKGILSQKKHRRLWNLLITAGYAGTGITGILLILIINLGIKTALNPSVTFWHAELSILMVLTTLIHIHIYWKPFKNMFSVLFGFTKSGRASTPTRSEYKYRDVPENRTTDSEQR